MRIAGIQNCSVVGNQKKLKQYIEIINRDFEEDFLKILINFIGLQYLTVVFK